MSSPWYKIEQSALPSILLLQSLSTKLFGKVKNHPIISHLNAIWLKISCLCSFDPYLILFCYLNDPQLFFVLFVCLVSCSWVPCLSWTVELPAVPQKNPSVTTNSLVLQHFVNLNPFQKWLYVFEIHLFTLRTTEGLICNYYRMFKRSLMLQNKATKSAKFLFHCMSAHFVTILGLHPGSYFQSNLFNPFSPPIY